MSFTLNRNRFHFLGKRDPASFGISSLFFTAIPRSSRHHGTNTYNRKVEEVQEVLLRVLNEQHSFV
jgi:hypothetical protein